MVDNGYVKIPIDRYDFLKGLELLTKGENPVISIMQDYYSVSYYTANEAIKKLGKDLELMREHKEAHLKLKQMSWSELKNWKRSL